MPAAAAEDIAGKVAAGSGAALDLGAAIGAGSMLLTGQNDIGRWANLMVYSGPCVVSVSASSPADDPGGPVVAIGASVMANPGFSP